MRYLILIVIGLMCQACTIQATPPKPHCYKIVDDTFMGIARVAVEDPDDNTVATFLDPNQAVDFVNKAGYPLCK